MIEIRAARFGRHVTRTVAPDEVVRVELRLPARTAAMLFELAHLRERTLSSVAGQAISEFGQRNPLHPTGDSSSTPPSAGESAKGVGDM